MKETYEIGPGRTVVVTIEVTGTGAEVREMAESNYPSELDWTAVRAERDTLRQVVSRRERRIAELERTLAGAIDREAKLDEELVKAENKIRGYDTDRHTERDRADRERQRASELKDRLSSSEERVKELEDDLGHRDRARDELNRRMLVNGQETARKLAQSQDLATRAGADRDLAVKRAVELEADLHRSEQSVRARDNLLGAATLKIEQARDLLGHDQVTQTRDKIVTTSGVYLADVIGQALDTLA